MELNDEKLAKIAKGILEGSIVNGYRVVHDGVTPSFRKKMLESGFEGYRKLIDSVEEEVKSRTEVQTYNVIAASTSLRHKPYFTFTWRPEDWPFTIKYETASDGLEDISTKLRDVEEQRKRERYASLHIVYPHECHKDLQPLISENPEERRREWHNLLQSVVNIL